jgi:hypothetical protein
MKRLLSILTILAGFLSPYAGKTAQPPSLETSRRSLVIRGGTLIDATGRSPIDDAVVVIRGDRIEAIGKRGEVHIPTGARVIDARGKTILPGFIDGHCHLRDFMGELYLHFGVTACPDISQNEDYWTIAIKDGTSLGKIRGPRIWAAGKRLLGTPPSWGRRVGFGYLVKTPEEARQVVREKKQLGLDIIKLNEFVTPDVLRAAADEANRLGLPVTCHCLDVFLAAEAGFAGVEHHWAPGMTSIADAKKKVESPRGQKCRQVRYSRTALLLRGRKFRRCYQSDGRKERLQFRHRCDALSPSFPQRRGLQGPRAFGSQ